MAVVLDKAAQVIARRKTNLASQSARYTVAWSSSQRAPLNASHHRRSMGMCAREQNSGRSCAIKRPITRKGNPMKQNKNYLDRIEATILIAAATCKSVNGEKDYPYWLGLTANEKYSKSFANERKVSYIRKADARRELKSLVNRICNDTEYRSLIKSRAI
jgi:hypothetical protein